MRLATAGSFYREAQKSARACDTNANFESHTPVQRARASLDLPVLNLPIMREQNVTQKETRWLKEDRRFCLKAWRHTDFKNRVFNKSMRHNERHSSVLSS